MFPLYSYMQSSRDYEELESESLEMGSEIVRLRRKLEQYLLKAEEKERELLGMREQGPQAVKDQLCARLDWWKRISNWGQGSIQLENFILGIQWNLS